MSNPFHVPDGQNHRSGHDTYVPIVIQRREVAVTLPEGRHLGKIRSIPIDANRSPENVCWATSTSRDRAPVTTLGYDNHSVWQLCGERDQARTDCQTALT